MFQNNVEGKLFKPMSNFANGTRKSFHFKGRLMGQRYYLKTKLQQGHFCITRQSLCGKSERKVFSLRKENAAKSFEGKKDCDVGTPKIKLDEFYKAALLRLVFNFYDKANPEIPTAIQILEEALLLPVFPPLSRTIL